MPLAMAAGRLRGRSDADLIQASKRGDLSAFEEIYAAHAGRMKSVAFHLLGDRADAEDAVQEAFLKIYRGAGAIQFEAGFAPWMYRILLNCCYDTGRKRRRQAESQLDAEPAAANDVPLAVALRHALGRIHPQYRMVFWLFEVEGFRHSEVASILEIPEGTSKKWLFEAKRELKRLLTESRA
ncbi:MAG: RNA polymerase sigma factor [Bryobacteraceae bacterium]